MLNRESHPCTEDEVNDEYDQCMFRFVENEIGCSSPWTLVERTEKLPICNSSSQFHRFIQETRKILALSPKQVYERIGCSAKCDRVEFSSVVYSRSENEDAESGRGVRERAIFNNHSQSPPSRTKVPLF